MAKADSVLDTTNALDADRLLEQLGAEGLRLAHPRRRRAALVERQGQRQADAAGGGAVGRERHAERVGRAGAEQARIAGRAVRRDGRQPRAARHRDVEARRARPRGDRGEIGIVGERDVGRQRRRFAARSATAAAAEGCPAQRRSPVRNSLRWRAAGPGRWRGRFAQARAAHRIGRRRSGSGRRPRTGHASPADWSEEREPDFHAAGRSSGRG